MQLERSVSLHKKKNVLECMQIFPAADQYQHQFLGGGGGGEGGGGGSILIFWTGVSNLTQELLAFTTPCSAAILPP